MDRSTDRWAPSSSACRPTTTHSTNDSPDTKVPPQEPADDNKPEPSKPPALFEEGSGYSFFGNLVGLLRTNSAGDAGNEAGTRAAPADGPVELPADFPQHYLGFCKWVDCILLPSD